MPTLMKLKKLNLDSNNQKIKKNILFDEIINDVYYIISNKTNTILHKVLDYVYDIDDSIEIKELYNFLISEIEVLKKIEEINYIKLYNYFIEFKKRIEDNFI